MTQAWEVTKDDVQTVLDRHGCKASAETLLDEHFVGDGRVEDAVLYFVNFELQCDVALSEIEDVLMEAGVITGQKKFTYDEADNIWDGEDDFDDDLDDEE